MSDVTRLVDELTTLLYEVLKRWEVEGRVCEIVACGACRKKADRPSSVVHESDCPVHRLWQALEIGEVVVRANAEEICDLEDARDALEAKVNALTAEMECRNQLTSRIAALEAERDAIKGERDFARVWSVRWKAVATRLWGGVHRALDAAEQLAARMQAAEAERDAARDWSARWKALALQYRTTARQNGESWQRLAEDFGAVSDENARLRAALEQAHTELFTVSLHSNPMLAYGHSQQAMQIIGAALAASAGEA